MWPRNVKCVCAVWYLRVCMYLVQSVQWTSFQIERVIGYSMLFRFFFRSVLVARSSHVRVCVCAFALLFFGGLTAFFELLMHKASILLFAHLLFVTWSFSCAFVFVFNGFISNDLEWARTYKKQILISQKDFFFPRLIFTTFTESNSAMMKWKSSAGQNLIHVCVCVIGI